MFLKICGLTRAQDAVHAAEQGATAIGFVFWPQSLRYVTPERAAEIARELPAAVTTVGVFVNQTADEIDAVADEVGLHLVQLHGDEPHTYIDTLDRSIIRSATLDHAESDRFRWDWFRTYGLLLDAHDPVRRGGTGAVLDWGRAEAVARKRNVILAGGLTADNVREAIARVRPVGVDVASGVEAAPGVKDPEKVTRFLANARTAFEACQ